MNGIGYVLVNFPFLKGLSYKFTLNTQRNSSESDLFTNPQFWINTQKKSEMANPYMYSENAHGTSAFVHSASWNVDNIFTYNKNFGKHYIDLIAGYTREATNIETLKSVYSDFDTTTALGTYGQDLAGTQKTARLRTESQSVAYLARINYNYYNRYYFTFNFRHDGYSAFAKGNKWANFPGLSAAWIISQENFMKGIKWVDFFKVRLSYGQNGSRGASPYSTIAGMSKTYTVFGSDSNIAMHPSSLANKSLSWATTGKWNIGFDFSVLSNRLNGSIDFYKSVTTHMLLTRSLPYLAGFSSSLSNAGEVNNKGVEFSLNSINMNGNGSNSFRWESNIVFSLNRNKVVKLFGKDTNGNEANDVANAITYGYQSAYALVIGKSITSAWDYKKLGIFQSQDEIDNYKSANGTIIQPDAKPGDIKFEDYNKDGKINSSGDRHWIGDQDPLFTVNLGNTLTYKNFSLYFNFRWNAGNNKHYLGSDPYGNYHATGIINGAQLKAEPWSDSNHTNTYSRLGYTNPYAYYFWRRRDFLKLKDISLSYTVDQSLLKSMDIQSMRIFFSGTDLFTITDWSGLDPENGGTIAAGPSSTTYGSRGTFKTISMGVNITF
ncbi:MAG: SusC/RagA family TonB-linked outer membrane protein [Massilibacteroides sp.]|nr:SusC/RagA family TonB-linked outer membrane protein [Massilibacteroides sp.]